MKKANLVLMAAMAAAGLAGVAGGTLLPVAAAVAADKAAPKQKLTPAVQNAIANAQKALKEQKYDEAATLLETARAVEPKTAYDSFIISEVAASLAITRKDYAAALTALETSLESGFLNPADVPNRIHLLAQLALTTKNFDKFKVYAAEYLKTNPNDMEIAVPVAQLKLIEKDYAGAKQDADRIIGASSKPSEDILRVSMSASYGMKDMVAYQKSLETLVRYYPQQKYWEDLLTNQLFRTKEDRSLRGLYRLMLDTDTLDKPDEYSEMSATLVNGGFPNEAKQVLERGMSAGVFTGESRTRAQGDLERAKSGAALDAKEIATADQQLAAAKTADQMVGIGKLYFSHGDYAKAADALQKGIARGGLKDADDANLLLGVAEARMNRPAEARAALDAVRNPTLAEIAHLWKLKLDVDAAPAAPATAG